MEAILCLGDQVGRMADVVSSNRLELCTGCLSNALRHPVFVTCLVAQLSLDAGG